MARYNQIFANLAQRAISSGMLNIEAFIANMRESGVSDDRIADLLNNDIDTDGPLFGPFFRALEGAASSTVMTAARQGDTVGMIDVDKELRRLMVLADAEDALEAALQYADPDAAAQVAEVVAGVIDMMWVAELVNTCHLCLPLHGQVRTEEEWKALGLHPDTIHPADWKSSCHCKLVRVEDARKDGHGRSDIQSPLARTRVRDPETGKVKKFKSRKTQRAITQRDIEKAIKARDEAMNSLEGRKTLRLLGQQRSGDVKEKE